MARTTKARTGLAGCIALLLVLAIYAFYIVFVAGLIFVGIKVAQYALSS